MNAAHLHLITNHLPVLGTLFGVGLLAFAFLKNSHELKRVALGAFVVVSVLAVPAYLTGEPAGDLVENLAGVSPSIIERHEDFAQAAFIAQIVLGIGALALLIVFRKGRPISARLLSAEFLLSIVVSGLMTWTALLGGQVRHTEIRSGSPATIQTEHSE